MTLKNIKNDNDFMRFVMNNGKFDNFTASDFKVGDKVTSIVLENGSNFEDGKGQSIYVNNEMARNSRDGKILEIMNIFESSYAQIEQFLN